MDLRRGNDGFTMVEILSVIAIIGVLVSLLLPAIQASREGARRMSCSSNLSQVGLAITGYHTAFNQFPVQLSGTDGSPIAGQDNDRRLSIFVALMPFLSQASVTEQIRQPLVKKAMDTYGYFDHVTLIEDESDDGSDDTTGEDPDRWVAGGPEPFQEAYHPWYLDLPALRCPSDPGVGRPSMGRSNYAVCLGDGLVASSTGPMKDVGGTFVMDPTLVKESEIAMRGIFVPRRPTQFSDVTDGLSLTILLAELATDLGDGDKRTEPAVAELMAAPNLLRDEPLLALHRHWIDSERPMFWKRGYPALTTKVNSSARRGFRWADGMPLFTGINTILPPNREITLSVDRENSDGVLPPSSRHQGGVHVCMADGAVTFITDSIDAGNPNRPTVYLGSYPEADAKNDQAMESPYGVWGAMGTRASAELVAETFEVDQ